MRIGAVRERAEGERRVALVPGVVAGLARLGAKVIVEAGAGSEAGISDSAYTAAGAAVDRRDAVIADSDILCVVRGGGAASGSGEVDDLAQLRRDQIVVGQFDPLGGDAVRAANERLAATGAIAFSLELLPRITRAQSMDVLSSQATVAGYKAVLLAAAGLPRLMPMMMTAAGTIPAAKALVIGAGVAGLQAIATLRRLGAVVLGYDVRSAVREQIESLGARFVDLLPGESAEGQGGYAKAMDEAFYERQRAALAKVCAEQEIVITTAAIPGRRSPLLVTRAAVESMRPGSVIVDLAAERGGNCELSRPDEEVVHGGVRILGPTNLPATVPFDASQMYARNLVAFLTPILRAARPPEGDPGGALDPARIDWEDEIVRETLLCRGGRIVHPRAGAVAASA